jgi:DnaJ-class molecular chaperone
MIKEHPNYYIILQTVCYTRTIECIVDEYSHLAILLDPHRNPFDYVARAFFPVHDARSILSDPHKKTIYDKTNLFSQLN